METKKQRKQMIEKFADMFVRNAIEVYKTQGEKAFRNLSVFIGLSEKDIDAAIKDLKKLNLI